MRRFLPNLRGWSICAAIKMKIPPRRLTEESKFLIGAEGRT